MIDFFFYLVVKRHHLNKTDAFNKRVKLQLHLTGFDKSWTFGEMCSFAESDDKIDTHVCTLNMKLQLTVSCGYHSMINIYHTDMKVNENNYSLKFSYNQHSYQTTVQICFFVCTFSLGKSLLACSS